MFALEGIRVLDFSQVLAGPYATRVLAELGADVIKLEAPAGDPSREIAPREDRGQSGLYTWANVAKRNVSIDLGKPEGRALALELVAVCHVVVENFRPGVADRLGIGWSDVHRANPRAVMLSVSGYGNDSSRRDRGAFAPTIHAASGLLDYAAKKARLPVHHTGDATADLVTALQATIALLAALRAAERTGTGEHVEVAMYDALLATHSETAYVLMEPPESRADADPYDAGQLGQMVVAGTPQHVWMNLAKTYADLADPSRPGDDVPTKARLRHAALERWMAGHSDVAALVAKLEAAGLACAPVDTLEEALLGEFGRERGMVREVDDRRGGTRRMTRLPYRFSRSRLEARRPAPLQGEHNAEVLRELLELSPERIAELEAAGVLLGGSR